MEVVLSLHLSRPTELLDISFLLGYKIRNGNKIEKEREHVLFWLPALCLDNACKIFRALFFILHSEK